ncbi:MAG: GNAT family N-acetyltransferase [Acidimicrobiia bacterium]|nr:GNAT family N-acetyltransferase [Acidimicrobiia bacterium]
MTVAYRSGASGLTGVDLAPFFAGWPSPPAADTRLAALRGASHVVTAWEGEELVGFVTAISDGAIAAFIPLLEVVERRRGRGIGSELVRRMLRELDGHYSIDVVCDEELVGFYERFGLMPWRAMIRRDRTAPS